MATTERSGLFEAAKRICNPERIDRCSECPEPRRWGEATCSPECDEKLYRAMFRDLDAEEQQRDDLHADALMDVRRESEV